MKEMIELSSWDVGIPQVDLLKFTMACLIQYYQYLQ